jgi:hypothetical protein
MNDVIKQLTDLQRRIAERNEPDALDFVVERLYFADVGGLIYVEYYGYSFLDASFGDLLNVFNIPDVASQIKLLAISGPDEGANGTRNSDFTPLTESETAFPQLTTLYIEPTAPEHHNATIVAEEYDEEGMLAKLLAKAPQLQSLTTPSAPDASFFKVGSRPLWYLRVDAGYDTQNFILNLSESSSFPYLRRLDYGDYNERYMEEYPKGCTPYEHYQALLQSPTFLPVNTFILRNSICTPEELVALKAIRRDLNFVAIQSHGEYVK